MSNAKEINSKLSKYQVEYAVPSSSDLQYGYAESKKRQVLFNENWKNKDYIVKADMASGYLKVYDRNLKTYLDKHGNPVPDGPDSHMKILRKEKM